MKKIFLLTILVLSITSLAQASDTFKTNADLNREAREKRAASLQREIDQLKISQDILAEMQKSNALNAEISTKLDKLLQSSDANNVLMDTLLKRTE